jgi:hypothetical protein
METNVKLFDTSNKDTEGNGQYLDIDLSNIQIIPRIGENVFFNNKHFIVNEIQHSFMKEFECKDAHTISIHICQPKSS